MKDWENETVTQKEPPLYQQGRFPSVVDTDDLVFELGKQAVDRINKEKLLDKLLKKLQLLEKESLASESIKKGLTDKIEEYKASNNLYVQNNEKLSAEITRQKNEIERVVVECDRQIKAVRSEIDAKAIEFTEVKEMVKSQAAKLKEEDERWNNEKLSWETEVVRLKSELEFSHSDLDKKVAEIASLKSKHKTPKAKER